MFLQRSKSAPLRLYGVDTDDTSDETLFMILRHASRLKEVDIRDVTHEDWLSALILRTTPLLQKLKLDGYNWRAHTRYHFNRTAPRDAPSLRSLNIAGCVFELSHPFFSNLTQLSIRYYDDGLLYLKDRLTPTELLHALRSMPRLQDMHLSDALDLDGTLPYNEGNVVLPLLSSLRLQAGEGTMGFEFLQYLNLPAIKKATIDCCFPASPRGMSIVAPIVHALLPPHDSSLLQSTFMIGTLHLFGYTRTVVKLEVKGPTNETLVAFDLTALGTTCLQCEHPLLSFRPIPDPEVLYFDGVDKHQDPSTLVPFLRDLIRVKKLHVNRLADITFALMDTPKDFKENDVPPPYALPKLKQISLFQERIPNDTEQLVVQVGKLLMDRKALDAAVETLEVVRQRSDNRATPEYLITMEDLQPLTGILEVVFR